MSVKQAGFSGVIQEVDANKSAYVTLKDTAGNPLSLTQREEIPSTQEGVLLSGKNDGVATMMRVDRKGNQITGNFNPEFFEPFEGTSLNTTSKWFQTFSGLTAGMTTLGGFNFNNGNVTTANAYGILQTMKYFKKGLRQPLQAKVRFRSAIPTNAYADISFGVPATTTQLIPNGVAVRFLPGGLVTLVHTQNSVELSTGNVKAQKTIHGNTAGANINLSDSYYTTNNFLVCDIILDDDDFIVTIHDTSEDIIIGIGKLNLPVGAVRMFGNATSLPYAMRLVNGAVAPSTAPVFVASDLQILSTDLAKANTPESIASELGMMSIQNPYTGLTTANITNSVAPTSATLSNTAGGYGSTLMDGKFQFAAVAGAVTDYALFAYQVPAGARFMCSGITIETINTGAAVATTPTVLEWYLGFNAQGVSLATASTRTFAGTQSLPIGAVIGAKADRIDMRFDEIPVESGRWLHVILNMPVATATASQIIRGTIKMHGRFI